MAGDGIHVEQSGLRSMARTLRSSTDDLGELASSMPDMPEVSTSAEKVGHTLSEITRTAAALAASVEDTAGKIDVADGSYGEVDNTGAEQLHQPAAGLGP
ncbi:hypothetical protein [Bounagaea algeriensis]